jgi:photosynthetic reaction center L subunit
MALLSFERKYRVPGGTLIGGDLFDFWVGPFYVGFFGVTTVFFACLGTHPDLLGRGHQAHLEPLADQYRAARPELRSGAGAADGGRALADHHDLRHRGISSAGRSDEVEICRKLGMGYHVPFAFSVAIFAYVTLVVIRPC